MSKKAKKKLESEDPYAGVRRNIPPPNFMFGDDRHTKNDRVRDKQIIEKEFKKYIEDDYEDIIDIWEEKDEDYK